MKTLAISFAALMAVACAKSSPSGSSANAAPTASAASGAPKQAADDLFKARCSPCHGAQGRGDGTASAGLSPKPRNFSDSAWQTEVDDAYIKKIIQYGGSAVGKSAAMPANPDLGGKPEVIAALTDKIRKFNSR